jgi:transcriptional regulator with GAF, ATPase, and Fis domain
MLDLLQLYDNAPDSLNLKGKLVLIGATLSGETNLKATPINSSIPASLLHLTCAENIINRTFLRDKSDIFHLVLIILLITVTTFLWKIPNKRWIPIVAISGILFLFIITHFLFRNFYIVIHLFYPFLAFLITYFYEFILYKQLRRRKHISLKKLLEQQLKEKEIELQKAKQTLAESQKELSESTSFSEQMNLISAEKEQKILQLESEIRDLKTYIIPEIKPDLTEFSEIIHSPEGKFREVLNLINRIKSDDIPVLILGETGTGKEIIARAIHQTSERERKPFVAVNCGALTETLLESELFGHEKGSFTGAHSRRRGRFEIADGGTIFLDEITETSPSFQAKLLRVLQEGIFERVGGEKSIQINVRIIAATNRNIESEISRGNFRSDLFYRLNGFPIQLPPLRKREEDIPLLVNHFIKKYGKNLVKEISDQALNILKEYDWPGNVRELENIIHRAVIFAHSEDRKLIRISDIPGEIKNKQIKATDSPKFIPLETQILDCLRGFNFSHSAISQTAKVLGNKDRGTITEYYRGLCFQYLVDSNFDIDTAAKNITNSVEEEPNKRVRKKIEHYLQNLPEISDLEIVHQDDISQLPQFKGLPKKYHDYLITLIKHYSQENLE